MKRQPQKRTSSTKPANGGRETAHLEDIPNVGPAVAADLRQLGITPGELLGRDPYAMYDDLCRITGQRHDPCLRSSPQFGSWKERRSSRGGSTRQNASER